MTKAKLIALGKGCSAPKSLSRDEEIEHYYRETEIDTLARTLWGEARGEGTAGMWAVAHVIINRVKVSDAKGQYWWGNNVIQVCQKPYQFSCWNRSDPNFRKLQALTEEDVYFATALRIARRILAGIGGEDPTGSATHYHAHNILPFWAKEKQPSAIIGNHIFYAIINIE